MMAQNFVGILQHAENEVVAHLSQKQTA